MKIDFSNFGMSFQEGLVALLIQDRAFCDQIKEVLNTEFFEYKYMQLLAEKIFRYKDIYKEHPNNATILALLKTELEKENELIRNQTINFFEKVHKEQVENSSFIKEKSIDFCKKQVLKSAMLNAVDLLEKSSFDEISTVINGALKLGLDNKIGHDYLKDFEDRYKAELRHPVSTGWELIDAIIKGGIGAGELSIVVAPSGAGKSHLLVHFGAQALKQGKNVIHYTLELSDKHVGNRYDACLTGIALDDLHICKEQILETINTIPGKLLIKEYPTKSVSVVGIRNHIERSIQRGFKPNMIIVDYPDLLKSSKTYSEKRYELESCLEELRAIGQYFVVPVIGASQTNRLGLDEDVVTLKTISEAFNKVFPADLIMCLSRNRDDRAGNTARLHIAKNRLGRDNVVFPLFFDAASTTIRVLKPEEKTNETEIEEPKEALKQKYILFSKKGKE